jgi:hypothetical protein
MVYIVPYLCEGVGSKRGLFFCPTQAALHLVRNNKEGDMSENNFGWREELRSGNDSA